MAMATRAINWHSTRQLLAGFRCAAGQFTANQGPNLARSFEMPLSSLAMQNVLVSGRRHDSTSSSAPGPPNNKPSPVPYENAAESEQAPDERFGGVDPPIPLDLRILSVLVAFTLVAVTAKIVFIDKNETWTFKFVPNPEYAKMMAEKEAAARKT